MAFATPDDLSAYLGRAVENTVQAQLALDLATGIIQAETGQTLELVTDDVVRLRGSSASPLYLPERPVVSVASIEGDDVRDDEWVHLGEYVTRAYGWPPYVTVTYTHGYEVIPDDVRGITLAIAARLMAQNDPSGPPVEQETIGTYSVRYARTLAAGGTTALLTDGERSHLRRTYRRTAGMVALR